MGDSQGNWCDDNGDHGWCDDDGEVIYYDDCDDDDVIRYRKF